MKKSNVIIFVILALVSIFLLWLWYYLGLNHVDEPLDLVISIIWWAIIIAAIVVIVRVEKVRKERIRTIFVSEDVVFNSEAGSLSYNDPVQLVSVLEEILKDLKYNFTKKDLPNKNAFPIKFIVHTSKFKDDTWEGDVVEVETKQVKTFENKEELFKAINALPLFNNGKAVAGAQPTSAPEVASTSSWEAPSAPAGDVK